MTARTVDRSYTFRRPTALGAAWETLNDGPAVEWRTARELLMLALDCSAARADALIADLLNCRQLRCRDGRLETR